MDRAALNDGDMVPPPTKPALARTTGRAELGPLFGDLVDQYWQWEQEPGVLIGYGRRTPQSLDNR